MHVGCGPQNKSSVKGFNSPEWQEIRFDIDPAVRPDVIGSLTDMSAVQTASVDALYSSHNIEHLYSHEVPLALKEFHRVLKPDGFVVITCPDLQTVCESIVEDKLLETLYDSQIGPIAPIDILYGHRQMIAQGNAYMAHKCGFTYAVLEKFFYAAGFKMNCGGRRPQHFDLWMLSFISPQSDSTVSAMADTFLP